MMHFGHGTAHVLHAYVTGLASSAIVQASNFACTVHAYRNVVRASNFTCALSHWPRMRSIPLVYK